MKSIYLFLSTASRTLFILFIVTFSIISCDNSEEEQPDPIISSFSPERGMPGTAVVVIGENFGIDVSNVQLKLGGINVPASTVSQTRITFEVSESSVTGPIAITVGEKTVTSSSTFEVFNTPSIQSFSPMNGGAGTEVTIAGTNFSEISASNTVLFNGVSTAVKSSTQTSIIVDVPANTISGAISITVNDLTATSTERFVVPPIIESVAPLTGITGTEVIITGSAFSTNTEDNKVLFNGQEAEITESTFTSLTVTVPVTASTGSISVQVLGEEVVTQDDFVVIPNITVFSPIEGPVNTVVTITGSGFSSTAADNTVQFKGIDAIVSAATVNELKVVVPTGAETGDLTVKVGENTATAGEFKVIIEAHAFGGSGFNSGRAIGVDADGNYYVGGEFQNEIDIEGTVLTSTARSDSFVAKFNIDGELVWVKQISSTSDDKISDIILDVAGNIIFSCEVGFNSTFGGIALGISRGIAVVKISSEGNILWSTVGRDARSLASLALDPNENVIITGRYNGVLVFGSVNVTSIGDDDEAYVAKLDGGSGDGIWIKRVAGTEDVGGLGVSSNASGDVFFTGSFFGTLTIESTSITSLGGVDSYFGKLTSNGDLVWLKQIGGTAWNLPYEMATDPSGDVVITGYFINETDFGGTSLTSVRLEDIYVAKYDSDDGALVWVNSAGSQNNDLGRDIVIAPNGSIYITGYIERTTDFGDQTLETFGNSRDVFMAELNNSGQFVSAHSGGTGESDSGNGLAVGSNGLVYVTGGFRDFTATFGVTQLENTANEDVFVWKIKTGN